MSENAVFGCKVGGRDVTWVVKWLKVGDLGDLGVWPSGLVRQVGSQIYPGGPPLREVVQDTVRLWTVQAAP